MINEYKRLNRGERLEKIMENVTKVMSEIAPDSGASFDIWKLWILKADYPISPEALAEPKVGCLVNPMIRCIVDQPFESMVERLTFYNDFKAILLNGAVTDITNDPSEWTEVSSGLHQCNRRSDLFYNEEDNVITMVSGYTICMLEPKVPSGWSTYGSPRTVKVVTEEFKSEVITTLLTPTDIEPKPAIFYVGERRLFPFLDRDSLTSYLHLEYIAGSDTHSSAGCYTVDSFYTAEQVEGVEGKALALLFKDGNKESLADFTAVSKRDLIHRLRFEYDGEPEYIYAISIAAGLKSDESYNSKADFKLIDDSTTMLQVVPVVARNPHCDDRGIPYDQSLPPVARDGEPLYTFVRSTITVPHYPVRAIHTLECNEVGEMTLTVTYAHFENVHL